MTNAIAHIFEGAAGLGESTPSFDQYGRSVQAPPPGGRPPFGPPPGGVAQLAPYAQPAEPATTAAGIPTWGWLAIAAAAAFGVYHFTRDPEEEAADDDDDGDRYAKNAASVRFMKPYRANGSSADGDEDDEDDDEDDDDDDGGEDDEEDDEDDDDEPGTFTPNPLSSVSGIKPQTRKVLAELEAIQNNYAR